MRVRLLGPVDVVDASGVVRSPNSALRRTLLALLALHTGRVLTTDWLLEHVWAGEPPDSGSRALRFHISQLRKDLGGTDLIETHGSGYRLTVPADHVDALAIEGAARTARAEGDRNIAAGIYQELLSMWRGAPFVDAAPCPDLDDEALRLAELHLTLTEEYLQSKLDAGAGRELVAELTRATTQNPLRGAFWSMLITAQYRAGLEADALRSYEQMRLMLADSLGLDPSSELQDLQQRILRQDPSLVGAKRAAVVETTTRLTGPGRRLPATKDLIGRDELLDDLMARTDASRLVTLVGPGGVGKTSIAVSLAAARSTRHADGSWFVDLTRVSSGDLVVTAIGTALGLHASEHGISIDDVTELLFDKELFIVADNCEHVVEEAAIAIDAIVSSCPNVHLLTTSREALGLLDEVEVRVPPLDDDGAIALLGRRATQVGSSLTPDESNGLAATLCRAVDGLPLGIELVAGQLRSMSLDDIVRQLEAGALLRADGQRGGNTRHRSLHSTVAWSYNLLPEPCKTLLRRLAVFRGGAHLEAIVAVCGDATIGNDEVRVRDLLTTLVNTSLVVIERVDGRTRYRLLETVRAFVVELLDDAEEVEVRGRHVREMVNLALQMRRLAEGADPATAFVAIHTESANLRAAVECCRVRGDHHSVLELVGGLGPFLSRFSGAIVELEEWVDLALSVENADPALRIDALLVGAFSSPRPDEVLRARANEAFELASRGDDPRAFAFAAYLVGDSHIDEFSADIEQTLVTAIDTAERAGLFPLAGGSVSDLANIFMRALRYDDADALLTPRLQSSGRYGLLEPYLLYQHARLQLRLGRLEVARTGFDVAMRAAEQTGVAIAVGFVWFGKGLVAEMLGDHATARDCMERSLVVDEQLNDRRNVVNDRIQLADICVRMGDFDAARLHARSLAEVARTNPGLREIGMVEQAYGLIAFGEGRVDEGRAHMLNSLRAFAPTHMTDVFLVSLDAMAAESSASRLAEVATEVRADRCSMPEAVAIIEDLLRS